MRKNVLIFGVIIFALVTTVITSQSGSYDESVGYEKSVVNENFPVPANANPKDVDFNNPNIKKGKKYMIDNIGGEGGIYPPEKYFEEIKTWGWQELEDEQMGHVCFFKKGDTIVSIVIKEDYFQLYELKDSFKFN